jgi:hypothetical protein
MIDPKLNEVSEKTRFGSGGSENPARAAAPRSGLSVNDTVASEANLSVGGQGADVSGVRAGSGAGAGSSHVTSTGSSATTRIAPNQSGIGTTPLSEGVQGDSSRLSHGEIAGRAYQCWHERGCPEGSPEEDWHRAERELLESRRNTKTSAAGA